jgi:hypothetical protein
MRKDSYFRNRQRAEQYIKIASENLQKAINEMCVGLDEHQLKGIIRFGDGVTLTITPSSNPNNDKEDYIVSDESMRTILQGVACECTFCELSGKEARECKIRKALLESLVIPHTDEGDCPYKL